MTEFLWEIQFQVRQKTHRSHNAVIGSQHDSMKRYPADRYIPTNASGNSKTGTLMKLEIQLMHFVDIRDISIFR
jgi:hypothetical protein